MVDDKRNLCRFPYLAHTNFELSIMKLVCNDLEIIPDKRLCDPLSILIVRDTYKMFLKMHDFRLLAASLISEWVYDREDSIISGFLASFEFIYMQYLAGRGRRPMKSRIH